MSKPGYVTPEEVVDALEDVIDLGLHSHYDAQSEETFVECKVCGEFEGHTTLCPIPAIERWQQS